MLDVANISDNRMHFMLASYIKSANGLTAKLKGIKLCGSKAMNIATSHVVDVLANEKDAHFFGTMTCHSAWACPRCTSRVMAEKSVRIACLIDALAKQGLRAFMLTFTLPHTDSMTCEQAFDVLQATWRMFSKDGNRAKNSQNKSLTAYGQFRNKFAIKHVVRVYEFTWGDANGWHPHIHALLWTPEKDLNALLEWENILTDRWIDCAKHCHLKLLRGEYCRGKFVRVKSRTATRIELVERAKESPSDSTLGSGRGFSQIGQQTRMDDFDRDSRDSSRIDFISQLYADYKRRPVTGHRAVYFSRDKKGNVRRESSSRYISGWGSNTELTREQFKTNHAMEGRYSPFEMLELAAKAESKAVKEHWLKLFCDYAVATRGHRRVCFSPNCGKIIEEFMKSNDYIFKYLKKNTGATEYQKVFWFSGQQWLDIMTCENDFTTDIRTHILELATKKDCWRLIVAYMEAFGIDVSKNYINSIGHQHCIG